MPGAEKERGVGPESLLSSHRAGKLLQVNPTSVNKWVAEGLIPAFRTPGGHRRIRAQDLVSFLREQDMPIPSELRGASGRARVVWVDDDERFLRSVERHLKEHVHVDYTLLHSGIDALLEVGALRPDLIVLDFQMPEVDGIEVCRRLRLRDDTAGIAVVFVSGNADDKTRRRALAAGARAFLTKPCRVDDVLIYLNDARAQAVE